MKHLLLTTIAAVLVVGCGESQLPETKQRPQTAKAPAVSIHGAARTGNIEAAKEAIAAGADVNAKDKGSVLWKDYTPLHYAAVNGHKEIADLLRKHGGKTGEELKDAGK
jgi:ankyrin repeat protein